MKTQVTQPPLDGDVQKFLDDRVVFSLLFVLGGDDGAERLISVYNPAVNIWAHLETQLPYPWTNMAAVHRKGYIYVVGGDCEPGEEGVKDFRRASRLCLNTLQWHELAPLRDERYNLAAVLAADTIYAIGGADMEMDPRNTMERYSIALNRWENMASMPDFRTECGAVTSRDRIYVIGGFDSDESLRSVLEYDVENNTWQPGPPMPVRLSSVRAALVGRQIFVAGGNQQDPVLGVEGPVSSCYCLDLDTRVWSVCSSMEAAREFHCLAALNGRLVVLGGEPAVEAYDPALDSWSQLGETEENRSNGAACTVPMDALGPELTGFLEVAWLGPA
jgi:hypothetical protein